MTLRPFQLLTAIALGAMAPAMANPHLHTAGSCQKLVQLSRGGFPRVAVGCGINPDGPRGYVNASNLYTFIKNGGRRIVISESQELSPNQWVPHSIPITGKQMFDAKGNNVLILP